MANALLGKPLNVEPFISGATTFFRITFEVWYGDISGARAEKFPVVVDVAPTDTIAQIGTKLGTAIRSVGTANNYTIAANAILSFTMQTL